MTNVQVFPLIRKNGKKIEEQTTSAELEKIAEDYMSQVLKHLYNQGIDTNSTFDKDFEFVTDFLKATLLRSTGQYHAFQDYIDTIHETLNTEKED